MRALRDGGVASTRLGVMGHGEFRPAAGNTTRDGKQKNRRVEVFLVPRQTDTPAVETDIEEAKPRPEK